MYAVSRLRNELLDNYFSDYKPLGDRLGCIFTPQYFIIDVLLVETLSSAASSGTKLCKTLLFSVILFHLLVAISLRVSNVGNF